MRVGLRYGRKNMKVQHILGIATIVIGSGGAAAVVKSIFPNWGLKKTEKNRA